MSIKWHWRDMWCWLKLHISEDGYSTSEMCGSCDKCNRVFAACGVIPCPMRFESGMDRKENMKEK